jgi:hypothetical protein
MSLAFHLSNALYLVSYAVKEILWLRLVTVLANIITLSAIAGMSPSPPLATYAWQGVFFVINLARLVQLIHERRPVRLSAELQRLSVGRFRHLRPRELVRLVAVGEVTDHAAGERVIRRGEPLAALAIVLAGTARVERDDAATVELADGAFLGELAYLTGRAPAADVVAATPLKVVRWPSPALRAYLGAHPEVRTVVQAVLAADLADKLRGRA